MPPPVLGPTCNPPFPFATGKMPSEIDLHLLRMAVAIDCMSKSIDTRSIKPLAIDRNSDNPRHNGDAI